MSTVNSFDKNQHFGELNSPLLQASGALLSPAARKALANANLGSVSIVSLSTGLSDVRFLEQPLVQQAIPTSQNATGTMTAAQVMNGIITSTSAAAVAATMPLGSDLETALVAAYPQLAVNDAFEFSVINTGPNTVTMTTNTGWTLVGTMTVATVTSARFKVRRTSANVFVMYRLA